MVESRRRRRKLKELCCTYTRIAHYQKTGYSFVVLASLALLLPVPARPAGMGNPLERAARPSVIGSVCN